ncbi:MAG: MFS transporter [bacterium]
MFNLLLTLSSVALFSDIVYEGSRSIASPFMYSKEASIIFVSFIAGLGEFINYFFRILFGYLADKTKKYWSFLITGYILTAFSVPLLAFANNYTTVGLLLLTERLGKAIRSPSKDTIISYIGHKYGQGFTFGIHELIDQAGAIIAPLIIGMILIFSNNNYKTAFLFLTIPGIISLILLFFAKLKFSKIIDNEIIENKKKENNKKTNFLKNKNFWIYILGMSLFGFGFTNFFLISYHYKSLNIFEPSGIAFLYSIAMLFDGLFAIIIGKLFDNFGIKILILCIFLSLLSTPLLFLSAWNWVIVVAIGLWGIGVAMQESVMKSYISNITSVDERATAFGIFNSIYGISNLVGAAILGYFYKFSVINMILFSVFLQLLGILFLAIIIKKEDTQNHR